MQVGVLGKAWKWLTDPCHQRWLTLLIIVLIILPRVTDLGVFRIIDEEHLWEWTEQFTRAVLNGDWAGTAFSAYPGLPFFWVQFINLGSEMLRRSLVQGEWIGEAGVNLVFHEWNRFTYLAQRRLFLGIVNALLIIWLYGLVRRLLGRRVGNIAGILLALDPFLLSESRVARVEALSAELVGLAVIALLLYFRERSWRWLALSGALGGLAVSTKSQNLLLVAFAGLALAAFWSWRAPRLGWPAALVRLVGNGVAWLGAALLAFTLVWPAMWVTPDRAINLLEAYASSHAADATYQETFFLGQTVVGDDPGPGYYGVAFALRLTPWGLIGLLAALIWLIRRRDQPDGAWPRRTQVLALLGFVVLYAALMSLGAHKRIRYILPLFPVADVVAACGLAWLGQLLAQRRPARWSPLAWRATGLIVLLGVQLGAVLPHHPYYYPYYNPLLGGGPVASRLIGMGWGEGMDQVAAYLNTKPDASNLAVATRFGFYMVGFRGPLITLDTSWNWLQADYLVFYIQQVQKMLEPSPGIIRYFQRQPAEHVVRLGGIDYAWIYPNPIQHPADPTLSRLAGQATLLGYRWVPDERPNQVRVIWQNDGLGVGQSIALRLVGEQAAGEWQACQVVALHQAAAAIPGEVVESVCPLPTDDLRPLVTGLRHQGAAAVGGLEFGVRDAAGNYTPFAFPLARTAWRLDDTGSLVPLSRAEMYTAFAARSLPPAVRSSHLNYWHIARLIGYQLQPERLLPGQALDVTLYWQSLRLTEFDLHQSVKLLDSANMPVGQVDQLTRPASSRWWPGQVISDTVRVPLADGVTPPALLRLDVGLVHLPTQRTLPTLNEAGREVPRTLTWVKLVPARWPDVEVTKRLPYVFGGALELLEAQLPEAPVPAGAAFALRTYWSVQSPVTRDYSVFVHMVDDAGRLVAQKDGAPTLGRYPTSAWGPGEVVYDEREITLPDDLPPGDYRLLVGLYDPVKGVRLAVSPAPTTSPADHVVLGNVRVR